jgi:hypothetical protein
MSARPLVYRVYGSLLTAGFVVLNLHYIRRLPPQERLFALVVGGIFFLFYLVAPTVFGAKVKAEEEGLRVQQYRTTLIPYFEIRRCYSFFLFPLQLVVVMTRRNFPLNVVITEDKLTVRRRSLTQDGELATLVKSRMTP